MKTVQHTQESLSVAYVHALAGMAGVNLVDSRAHDCGVDGSFRPVIIRANGRRVESGEALDFQLKSSTRWRGSDTHIAYDLEAETFNDFVTRSPAAVPFVLLLLCLPKSEMFWFRATERETSIRHGCYWFKPSGASTVNSRTVTIQIPRTNLLSVGSLLNLLSEGRAGAGL
ncbi:DUF4365 domain-containing protein [Methylobacterium adhaesivum]|uniref:DUF4365 domain-containing protein n=1 Tax=Methylobacterium adhaesivum TaxID=333297 RepID=UPI00338F12F4